MTKRAVEVALRLAPQEQRYIEAYEKMLAMWIAAMSKKGPAQSDAREPAPATIRVPGGYHE